MLPMKQTGKPGRQNPYGERRAASAGQTLGADIEEFLPPIFHQTVRLFLAKLVEQFGQGLSDRLYGRFRVAMRAALGLCNDLIANAQSCKILRG